MPNSEQIIEKASLTQDPHHESAPKRVLIAEDNPDLRDIFARTFHASRFEVHTVEDGQEAIDSLNEEIPDVILLDINMPKLSGFDVLSYVRRHKETHDIKVIVVTGNSLALQDQKAQYADLFLVKPVSVGDLIAFTNRLIG